MDELDSKLRNLEELEAARAKEAWEKHVVSTLFGTFAQFLVYYIPMCAAAAQCDAFVLKLIYETHIKNIHSSNLEIQTREFRKPSAER